MIQKDPVALKKIRELSSYTFVAPEDPNYIPLSEILIPIDSNNPAFDSILPKIIRLSQIVGGEVAPTTHVESDILTELSSASISVTFDLPFDLVPIGRKNLYCWKSIDGYDYTYILKNINITILGFTCTIEDVTGEAISDFADIYFEYKFEERT